MLNTARIQGIRLRHAERAWAAWPCSSHRAWPEVPLLRKQRRSLACSCLSDGPSSSNYEPPLDQPRPSGQQPEVLTLQHMDDAPSTSLASTSEASTSEEADSSEVCVFVEGPEGQLSVACQLEPEECALGEEGSPVECATPEGDPKVRPRRLALPLIPVRGGATAPPRAMAWSASECDGSRRTLGCLLPPQMLLLL